ncbi:MAG: NADPH-dependent F420 reductase [Dermatophilaceae bacterium]
MADDDRSPTPVRTAYPEATQDESDSMPISRDQRADQTRRPPPRDRRIEMTRHARLAVVVICASRHLELRRARPFAGLVADARTTPAGRSRECRCPASGSVSMTTWGMIGSGNIGSTLARLAVDAGHDVVLSNSRGPETLADLVSALGPRARAGTTEDAVTAGDVVVVTVPLRSLGELPLAALDGAVVIDTMNYYPDRDGRIDALEDESTTTSEMLQAAAPGARVVKGFNTIFFRHLATLARPGGAPDRTTLPIAGDDADAKRVAARVIGEVGYDTLDLGPLAEGWRIQRDTAAYGRPYGGGVGEFWDAEGTPVSRDTLAAAVAQARRHADS